VSDYRVGVAFRYAARKLQKNFVPLVLITVALLVTAALIRLVGNYVSEALVPERTYNLTTGRYEGGGGGVLGLATMIGLLFSAFAVAVSLVLGAGLVNGALLMTRGHRIDVRAALRGISWGQVVVASAVIAAVSFAGLVLFVLPGIAVLFLTSFTHFFVIDRKQDAMTAIRSSVGMVGRHWVELAVFWMTALAAYIVGVCLCGLGLLAAVPIVILAQAYTFRTLNNDPVRDKQTV
jgi:hypothetical protein